MTFGQKKKSSIFSWGFLGTEIWEQMHWILQDKTEHPRVSVIPLLGKKILLVFSFQLTVPSQWLTQVGSIHTVCPYVQCSNPSSSHPLKPLYWHQLALITDAPSAAVYAMAAVTPLSTRHNTRTPALLGRVTYRHWQTYRMHYKPQ